ncbi:MAG: hypothetical protein AAGJ81_13015 [Verrucomicrobiota bacterium]
MNRKSIFLLPTVIGMALSHSGYPVSIQTAFNYLNAGMPDAFEIGQEVLFEIDFSDESIGGWETDPSTVESYVTSFQFGVPEAGFLFESSSAHIEFLGSADSLIIESRPESELNFGGLGFLGVEIEFDTGGFDSSSDALRGLTQDRYIGFHLDFYDPSGGQGLLGSVTVSGSIVVGDSGSLSQLVLGNSGALAIDFDQRQIIQTALGLLAPGGNAETTFIPEANTFSMMAVVSIGVLLFDRRTRSRKG